MSGIQTMDAVDPSMRDSLWDEDPGEFAAGRDSGWLLSFIDILALLLTLFVLLLAYESSGKPMRPAATLVASAEAATPLPEPDMRSAQQNTATPEMPALTEEPTASGPLEVFEKLREPRVIDLPFKALESEVFHASMALPATAAPASHEDLNASHASDSAQDTGVVTSDDDVVVATTIHPLPTATPLASYSPAAAPPVVDTVPASMDPAALSAPDAAIDRRTALLASLDAGGLTERVEISVAEENLSIEISDSILFAAASAELNAGGEVMLQTLAASLVGRPFAITVEGHTDDRPIKTRRYPSNWELSAARASIVARTLIEQGLAPERLRAIGYGDTRPRATNQTPQGRASNRRVTLSLELLPEPLE